MFMIPVGMFYALTAAASEFDVMQTFPAVSTSNNIRGTRNILALKSAELTKK
jgi:hypothetical protein